MQCVDSEVVMQTPGRRQKIPKMFMSVFAYYLLGSEQPQKCKATVVYAECFLLSNPYFAHYLCILSCSEAVLETKHKCGLQGDQRFNLTRWDKLEKDFDFPLCFATRKADFFFLPSFLCQQRQRSGHPQRNEQVWPFTSMSGYIIYQHKKSLKWFEKIC